MSGMRLCAMGVLVALASSSLASGEAVEVDSKLEAVTVYRGQALVTRSVTLPARAGELELVVGDLPAQLEVDRLVVSGGREVEAVELLRASGQLDRRGVGAQAG